MERSWSGFEQSFTCILLLDIQLLCGQTSSRFSICPRPCNCAILDHIDCCRIDGGTAGIDTMAGGRGDHDRILCPLPSGANGGYSLFTRSVGGIHVDSNMAWGIECDLRQIFAADQRHGSGNASMLVFNISRRGHVSSLAVLETETFWTVSI